VENPGCTLPQPCSRCQAPLPSSASNGVLRIVGSVHGEDSKKEAHPHFPENLPPFLPSLCRYRPDISVYRKGCIAQQTIKHQHSCIPRASPCLLSLVVLGSRPDILAPLPPVLASLPRTRRAVSYGDASFSNLRAPIKRPRAATNLGGPGAPQFPFRELPFPQLDLQQNQTLLRTADFPL
jgi:hypothetical protein